MQRNARTPFLILDVDETLVHASDKQLPLQLDFEVGPYWVYQRPFLKDFISLVATRFSIAVWSSSSEGYLASVLEQIIPAEVSVDFCWGRSRCVQRYDLECQYQYRVKDLKKVERRGFDLSRVLMVDDTPKKLERNYGNAIYVKPFEGDPKDDELHRLGQYLSSLKDCEDVRSVEKRGWRTRH